MSYRINLNNASEKVRQELKLADLQRRIDNIERILGNSGIKKFYEKSANTKKELT